MKKEIIKKIEEEINQKTTLPNNLKEKMKKNIFTNIIIALTIIIYFTFLIKGSEGTVKTIRSVDFNIFSILLLGVSIYLFEIAYKKDSGSVAIYGIETLVVSIITLFFPYIIFELGDFYKKYYIIVSICIGIYYIIKSIWIRNKVKKVHVKQSSDIKEIVKKEKAKRILEDIEEVEEETNKRGRSKKVETTEGENIQKKENTPKKRGRPRKVEISND